MWESKDIWVRHSSTIDFTQTHQNPEFGQVNYVHVLLRNKGPKAIPSQPAAGVVKLYWAKTATALTWPKYWNWFADIPLSLPASSLYYANAPWVAPATEDFSLMALWVCEQDPMNGALGTDPVLNTRQNNNIVWRNVNAVFPLPDIGGTAKLIVRNPSLNSDQFDLRIRARPSDEPHGDTFLDYGEIFFDLGPRLFDLWQRAGGTGSGFELVTNEIRRPVFRALNQQDFTLIRGIPMDGAEEQEVAISFRSRDPQERNFMVEVVQLRSNGVAVGGVTYDITMKLTNDPPLVSITAPTNGARFRLGRPIVIEAHASDPDGTITNVGFFADSLPIGEATLRPFGTTWSNAPVGQHVLTTVASDNYGIRSTSTPVTVSVVRPPVLNVAFANSVLVISWDEIDGVLEEADDVTGPWTRTPNAHSPYLVQPTAARKFYRLHVF
jgi:hypothetical protein